MTNYWFDHVHVISNDPLRTAEFYERMFGAQKVDVSELSDGRTLIELKLNGASIKIMHPRTQALVSGIPQTGYEHFGMKTDNIEEAVDKLKTQGVKFVQDIVAAPGLKSAFFLAPDNVLIELMETSS